MSEIICLYGYNQQYQNAHLFLQNSIKYQLPKEFHTINLIGTIQNLLVDERNLPAHPYRAPYKMSVDMAAIWDFDNDLSKWRTLKVVQIVPFCDLGKKNSFQICIIFSLPFHFIFTIFFSFGRVHLNVIVFSFIPDTKIVLNQFADTESSM